MVLVWAIIDDFSKFAKLSYYMVCSIWSLHVHLPLLWYTMRFTQKQTVQVILLNIVAILV